MGWRGESANKRLDDRAVPVGADSSRSVTTKARTPAVGPIEASLVRRPAVDRHGVVDHRAVAGLEHDRAVVVGHRPIQPVEGGLSRRVGSRIRSAPYQRVGRSAVPR